MPVKNLSRYRLAIKQLEFESTNSCKNKNEFWTLQQYSVRGDKIGTGNLPKLCEGVLIADERSQNNGQLSIAGVFTLEGPYRISGLDFIQSDIFCHVLLSWNNLFLGMAWLYVLNFFQYSEET